MAQNGVETNAFLQSTGFGFQGSAAMARGQNAIKISPWFFSGFFAGYPYGSNNNGFNAFDFQNGKYINGAGYFDGTQTYIYFLTPPTRVPNAANSWEAVNPYYAPGGSLVGPQSSGSNIIWTFSSAWQVVTPEQFNNPGPLSDPMEGFERNGVPATGLLFVAKLGSGNGYVQRWKNPSTPGKYALTAESLIQADTLYVQNSISIGLDQIYFGPTAVTTINQNVQPEQPIFQLASVDGAQTVDVTALNKQVIDTAQLFGRAVNFYPQITYPALKPFLAPIPNFIDPTDGPITAYPQDIQMNAIFEGGKV